MDPQTARCYRHDESLTNLLVAYLVFFIFFFPRKKYIHLWPKIHLIFSCIFAFQILFYFSWELEWDRRKTSKTKGIKTKKIERKWTKKTMTIFFYNYLIFSPILHPNNKRASFFLLVIKWVSNKPAHIVSKMLCPLCELQTSN